MELENLPILGRDRDELAFKQVLAKFGAPAYVRRARQVQDAFEQLVDRCRQQREEWLAHLRLCLGRLHALAGDWERLSPWLANEDQLTVLRDLYTELQPQLRISVEVTSSARTLRRALAELSESLESFNRRWLRYLETVDRSEVNKLRDGYNRYYLLEKECAVRSAVVARQGFYRLPPLTLAELTAVLPPLPTLRQRR